MSKKILQFIVILLAVLIVICFVSLIVGMYLKISGNQNENSTLFNYKFDNIQKDIIWWGNVSSNSLFSNWDNIETPKDTIQVINRPVITDLIFNLNV